MRHSQHKRQRALALAVFSLALSSPVLAGQIQASNIQLPSSAAVNADAVKALFQDAYSSYKTYAFGHDDLAPVSKAAIDDRNGWGATIVDSMSTMLVMGLTDLYSEALNFTSKIDFSRSKTASTASVFETTIRYIGGALSAYELNGKKDAVLVTKAKQIADRLAFAWTAGHDIPYGFVDIAAGKPTVAGSNIAEAGTLVLEWATLSKHTGNSTYQNLALKAFKRIATNPAPLPGLAAQGIDPTTGSPSGDYVTWGGGSDSYFEYLIKYPRLSNTADATFQQTWSRAVDSSIRYLKTTSTVGGWTYLTDYTGGRKRYIGSHLQCFHGGNWIMGGKLLNNQTIVDLGLKLVDSCWNTYAQTATGIGPEVFAYIGTDGNYTGGNAPSSDDTAFYNKAGYYVFNGYGYYDLRPEVLESNFYAFRATGDSKYLDRAAAALKSFQTNLKAAGGYGGIQDVRRTNSGFIDETESFFFAETLKYLYLTFTDPTKYSLDKYVFNTEAHPFEAPATFTPASPTKTHGVPPPQVSSAQSSVPLPAVSANPRLPKQLGDILQGILNGIFN